MRSCSKPLPFPEPEQLVALGSLDLRDPRMHGGLDSVSGPDFFDYRAQNHSFAHLAIYHERTYALAGSAQAQSLRGQRVSAEFFNVLGVQPEIGRTFRREEEVAGADRSVTRSCSATIFGFGNSRARRTLSAAC